MKVMSEFGKLAPNAVFLSLLLGTMAGVCYVGLIPLVLSNMEEPLGLTYLSEARHNFLGFEVSNSKFALVFFILCAAILIMRTASQIILTRVSVKLTTEIRKRLYKSIISSPIDALERVGPSRVITAMVADVARIVAGANTAPPILINAVTITGMLFYIWIVNSDVFNFVIISLIVGAISYQIPMILGRKYYAKARHSMDELQEAFRAIVHGAKELKLNQAKRESFIENELLSVESHIRSTNLKANTIATAAMNYGDMLSFFVIGCLSFVFVNYHQVSTQELIAIVMIMLYISGPVSAILFSIPLLIQANISYRKMNDLFDEMVDEECQLNNDIAPDWNELILKDVSYSYDESDGFTVGPIDLTIKKGEITFIVGGNGSGKSTFSKIITQHYYPKSGEVFFGDVKVDKANINSFRQCISSIYSDYYLFNSVHGINLEKMELQEKVDELLTDLGLNEKVKFESGKFSTVKLSDGQRRRLALLVAFIEDKDLYLFDEWAADQDPVFRDVYYKKILPELKEKGKAVVAISHDDRYFHVADKLVKFESGVLV